MSIIWNREAFDELLRATSLAIQQRSNTVRIFERIPRKGFWRAATVTEHIFTIAEARQKIAELKPEFHLADRPAGEYREGREGE